MLAFSEAILLPFSLDDLIRARPKRSFSTTTNKLKTRMSPDHADGISYINQEGHRNLGWSIKTWPQSRK
jgi:hypothetical protein